LRGAACHHPKGSLLVLALLIDQILLDGFEFKELKRGELAS
jgi:hypothetical protein